MTRKTDLSENTGSTLATLKENSLRASGLAFLAGDAALFASGWLGGRYKEAATGLIWAAGGLACAKYGDANADKQLELLARRLGTQFRKQGIAIPSTPDTTLLAQKDGVLDGIENFLYANPSQVLNAVYAVGGLPLALSGIRHRKPWDTAAGALVTLGGLGGIIVPEKTPDPNNPPHNLAEWFGEKPLRIPALCYGLTDISLIMSAFRERRTNPAQKSYYFKFLTAACYLFGNALLSMSSKEGNGKNGEHQKVMEQLADKSARVIAAQHPEVQAALTQQIAGYLAGQPEVKMRADEINGLLQAKLAELQLGAPPPGWRGRTMVSMPSSPFCSPSI